MYDLVRKLKFKCKSIKKNFYSFKSDVIKQNCIMVIYANDDNNDCNWSINSAVMYRNIEDKIPVATKINLLEEDEKYIKEELTKIKRNLKQRRTNMT